MINLKEATWDHSKVEWSLVEQIVKEAESKFQKEREFNSGGELNLMRILASSSGVLERNNIDSSKDTDYYHFFLAVSRLISLGCKQKDWMSTSSELYQQKKREEKDALVTTINNELQSIELRFGDMNESRHNFTHLNMSDLNLSILQKENKNTSNYLSTYYNNNSNSNTTQNAFFSQTAGKQQQHQQQQTMNNSKLIQNNKNSLNLQNLNSSDFILDPNYCSGMNSINKCNASQNYLDKTTRELSSNLGFDHIFLDQALKEVSMTSAPKMDMNSQQPNLSSIRAKQGQDNTQRNFSIEQKTMEAIKIKQSNSSASNNSSQRAQQSQNRLLNTSVGNLQSSEMRLFDGDKKGQTTPSAARSSQANSFMTKQELFNLSGINKSIKISDLQQYQQQDDSQVINNKYLNTFNSYNQESQSNYNNWHQQQFQSLQNQKHNVSFGKMKAEELEQKSLLIKSKYFSSWKRYSSSKKIKNKHKEDEQKMLAYAQEFYSTKSKHKVLVLLKGYKELSIERRGKVQIIEISKVKRTKQKYLQLFFLAFCIFFSLKVCLTSFFIFEELRQVEMTQEQLADQHLRKSSIKRYLRALKGRIEFKRDRRNKLKGKVVKSRIYIEFILVLLLKKSQINSKYQFDFWSKLYDLQPQKAIQVIHKYQDEFHTDSERINDILLPQLKWYTTDLKKRAWKGWLKYCLMVWRMRSEKRKRKLQKVFENWKSRVEKKSVINKKVQFQLNRKYSQLISNLIYQWRNITVYRNNLRQKYKYLRIDVKIKLLENVFAGWKDRYDYIVENREEITQGNSLRSQIVKKMVWNAWKILKYRLAQTNENKMMSQQFRIYSLKNKVITSWKQRCMDQKTKEHLKYRIKIWNKLATVRRTFKAWKEEIIISKMIKNFQHRSVLQKAVQKLKINQQESQKQQAIAQEFFNKKQIKNKSKIFHFLKNQSILTKHRIHSAFLFFYSTRLKKCFHYLAYNKEYQYQRRQLVDEFLRNRNYIQCFRVMNAWRTIATEIRQEKSSNKIAVHFFLKRLFKKMIFVLGKNVSRQREERQKVAVLILRRKRRILQSWRVAYHSLLAQSHHKSRVLFQCFNSLATRTKMQKSLNEVKDRASQVIQRKRFQQLSDCFQALFVYSNHSIKQKKLDEDLERYSKIKILTKYFNTLANIIKRKKLVLKNCVLKAKERMRMLQSLNFKIWQRLVTVINFKRKAIDSLICNNATRNIQQAFSLWIEAMLDMKEEQQNVEKGIILQKYIQSKRLFTKLKTNAISQKGMREKQKAAEFYYKQCSFWKFTSAFYASIQNKKQKFISLRHYAFKVLSRSFYQWKQSIKDNNKEQRFFKMNENNYQIINKYQPANKQENLLLPKSNLSSVKKLNMSERRNHNHNHHSNNNNEDMMLEQIMIISNQNDYQQQSKYRSSNQNSFFGENTLQLHQDEILTSNLSFTGINQENLYDSQ